MILHDIDVWTENIFKGNFSGEGWKEIRSLTISLDSVLVNLVFNDKCFSNLISLSELHIHVLQLDFFGNVFAGLENVTFLDLTNSTDVKQEELEKCFAPGIFPTLEKLVLCKTGIKTRGYYLDRYFWKSVNQRPITFLDISHMYIAKVDAKAFENNFEKFETIIARGAYIGSVETTSKYMKLIPSLKYLDLRDIIISSNILCVTPVVSVYFPVTLNADYYGFLANVETILLDNICQSLTQPVMHHFYVPYLRFSSSYLFHLKNVSFNNNNIAYADIHASFEHTTLEVLSVNGNNMVYLSPSTLACFGNLSHLDLTNNKLGQMMVNNETQFVDLLGG